jgi:hypothetical protein
MSVYANLVDPLNPTGGVDFLMSAPWQPVIKEVAGVYAPLGYAYYVKSTDRAKGVGGVLSITSTSDAMDALVIALMETVTTLQLTMPNGVVYYIFADPQQDRKGSSIFSQMLWQPVNIWTFYYYEGS